MEEGKMMMGCVLMHDGSGQVHHGAGVSARRLRYHLDHSNSLLHMAISIRGRRKLMAYLGKSPRSPLKDVVALPQQPGDVYLGSAALYYHAVAFEPVEWDERIISLQCRFLMSQEELERLDAVSVVAELSGHERLRAWLCMFSIHPGAVVKVDPVTCSEVLPDQVAFTSS
jgi:hypothetical protein